MKRIENFLTKYFSQEEAATKADACQIYMDKLLEINEYINLTAIKDPDEFIEKHYLDSFEAIDALMEWDEAKTAFLKAKKIIDIGTGGGFPGIPFAIFFKEIEFLLVDSVQKKLRAVEECAKIAGITNIRTFHGRVEDLGQDKGYRETFDICTSRALANMATLSEYSLPFVKEGGYVLAFKGPKGKEELQEAKKAITTLGGEEKKIFATSQRDDHLLIAIKKIKRTPKKYPRNGQLPRKNPIK